MTEQPGAEGTPGVAGEIGVWARRGGLPTPVFGFVPQVLEPGVRRLRDELSARVSYATKANADPLFLQRLAPLVDEFNVTNLAHLDQLLALGVEPYRIAWVHPILTPELRDGVLRRGVRRFVVDDRRGLDLLLASQEDVALTLRLLPPDAGESARSVVRFGASADTLRDVARTAASAGLSVEGVSFFVGTHGAGMEEAMPFRRGLEALAPLHRRLRSDGIHVPTINIGGGFPGSRRRFHRDHPEYFHRIREALEMEIGSDVSLLCEPGRYLAEPALVLVTRVLADRELAGRRLVHVDASAFAGLFEATFIDPDTELTMWPQREEGPGAPAELLGPVMDSFDVIRSRQELPALREGGLLMLPNVGAYAVGYSSGCEGLSAPGVVTLPEYIGTVLSEEWFA